MRRPLVIGIVTAAVAVLVFVVVMVAQGDDGAYRVRAIFDNASTIVVGEDVKIAGTPVGVVESMDVADRKKAALTLRIDNPDFTPFKADASCSIHLQGLIGERFIECEPGSTQAPALRTIEHGDTPSGGTGGEGERLLPVARTSSPVDLDQLSDIMRLPYRQRFAIILSEFGAGLAGRGGELNQVIHRANPALRETERVLRTLAKQNHVLARLATDSDRALAPLARERKHVSHFIVAANQTGEASAERSADIRRGINRLPAFLRELRPLMADLQGFATDSTPVVHDLGVSAPSLARLIKGQGELADAGRTSFPSLGNALERARPALIGSRPLIRNLGRFARDAKPTSKNLDLLTASLAKTGGPERIMDFLYYATLSTNGFDAIGHYLRAGLVTNTCSNFTLSLSPGCNATFYDTATGSSAASARASNATAPATGFSATATRNGSAPATGLSGGGSVPATAPVLQRLLGAGETPAQTRERKTNLRRLRQQASQPSPGLGPASAALDYLLGSDE